MDKKPTPIIPSIAPDTEDLFLDRLMSPARFFKRPHDVLADATLDVQEKRAILSSWASDACAVESMPALRQPPGADRPVSFDEIMDALVSLDRLPASPTGARRNRDTPERLDARRQSAKERPRWRA